MLHKLRININKFQRVIDRNQWRNVVHNLGSRRAGLQSSSVLRLTRQNG